MTDTIPLENSGKKKDSANTDLDSKVLRQAGPGRDGFRRIVKGNRSVCQETQASSGDELVPQFSF